MSSRIHCPYCGKKKREVSRSVENCIHCDKPLPACPECGSRNIGFSDVDSLGCYRCKTEFPPADPLLRRKGTETDKSDWGGHWGRLEEDELLTKVTEEEFIWVKGFAKQLKSEFTTIPDYDPMSMHQKRLSQDRNLAYLLRLRRFLHIGPLLEFRRDFLKVKSPAAMISFTKDLPAVEWFADKVVACTMGVVPLDEEERFRWGSAIREELGKSFMVEDQAPVPPPNWRKKVTQTIPETCRILSISKKSVHNYLDKGWLKQAKNKRVITESIKELISNPPSRSRFKKP